ncbi:MAG: family 10 glycosylhydrolase [Pirellula sp.]
MRSGRWHLDNHWSEFLTGQQGRPPTPFYDPLDVWIEESHKRGIELHAWFNPYRAKHKQAKSPNAPNHVSNTIPRAVKEYDGYLWMDPAESAASDHTYQVILDVVKRYDVDGIHFDDYFYPYPVNQPGAVPAVEIPFPDEPAWQAYLSSDSTPKLTRDDWRRRNVNDLIRRLYEGIKREKHHVKFGISPFGIGKPSTRPIGISGFSQYDKLYADAELWLEQGWVDYFSPQLYWPIDQAPQAFGVLLDYWAGRNPTHRHIWPGLFTSRISNSANSWSADEISNQIQLTQVKAANDPAVLGHIHFSMKALVANRKELVDRLLAKNYTQPALIPACPWLDNEAPAIDQFVISKKENGWVATPRSNLSPDVSKLAVWTRSSKGWRLAIEVANDSLMRNGIQFGSAEAIPTEIRIAPVDRVGNLGSWQLLAIPN